MNIDRRKLSGIILLGVGIAFLATGCGGQTVSLDTDTIACVYDGHPNGGHRFKRTVEPGARVTVDKSDEVVRLPLSTRYYNMTTTQNRNALAPSRLLAFTKGQTAVWIEGVLKFRFNTQGDKACKWYSRFGVRSTAFGDLGFTAQTKTLQRR